MYLLKLWALFSTVLSLSLLLYITTYQPFEIHATKERLGTNRSGGDDVPPEFNNNVQGVPPLFTRECRLSALHQRFDLTRAETEFLPGRRVCSGLPVETVNLTNSSLVGSAYRDVTWARMLKIGWRSEFDRCSVGVALPRTKKWSDGAKKAIKSLLYFRTTPVTLYLIVDKHVAQWAEKWFLKHRFPYVRVVFAPADALDAKIGEKAMKHFAWRGNYASVVLSYVTFSYWALRDELFIVSTADDMVHMTDPKELALQFWEADVNTLSKGQPQKFFATSRGWVYDFTNNMGLRTKQTFAKFNATVGAISPMLHNVQAFFAEEEFFWNWITKSLMLQVPNHVLADMDVVTGMAALEPNRVSWNTGCYGHASLADWLYPNALKTTYPIHEILQDRGYICDSVPHVAHMKIWKTNVDMKKVNLPHAMMSYFYRAFLFMPAKTLTLCPFAVSREDHTWYWDPKLGDIWGKAAKVVSSSFSVNTRKSEKVRIYL